MAACRMNDMLHVPVLLHEAVQLLVTDPNGIYIDATFGRGSHSQALLNQLSQNGRLIAIDRDLSAVEYAKKTITDKRFEIFHAPFSTLSTIVKNQKLNGKVAGVLFDLGVSSPQFDEASRGFSFRKDGPLDMRMDKSSGIDAATWLASVDEKTLSDILWKYGEERFSRQIARKIVAARIEQPITTTKLLADIIQSAIPAKYRPRDKHAATKSFQAIRIYINQELEEIETVLMQLLEILSIGGRFAVISFHSLEDRMVKDFIRVNEKGETLPRGLPIKTIDLQQQRLRKVTKPIKPSENEMLNNPRARSAILRVAEKTS